MIRHHNQFGVTEWQHDVVRGSKPRTADRGWTNRQGFFLSTMKFSQRCRFSRQLKMWLYLELLLLLVVVDACQKDKSIRYAWEEIYRQPCDKTHAADICHSDEGLQAEDGVGEERP